MVCSCSSLEIESPFKNQKLPRLALLHKLNTKGNLSKESGKHLGACLFCDDSRESKKHLFIHHCSFISKILLAVCSSVHVLPPSSSMMDLCLKWRQSLIFLPSSRRTGNFHPIAAFVRSCWKKRNARLFLDKLSVSSASAYLALNLLIDWSILPRIW